MALPEGITPFGGAESMAIPAAPTPRSSSIWTNSPPKLCPMSTGFSGIARMSCS